MFLNLHIRNVAIIEDLEIEFGTGLNVLSGETGAGKSIIIDAINFVLGGRADKDFLRSGADEAFVSALIFAENSSTLEENSESEIVITRTLHKSGRGVCKINGQTVTVSMLKEISESLADVHGQHEHQSLLNTAKHLSLLDGFCQNELAFKKSELLTITEKYRSVISEIKATESNETANMELLLEQIKEIEDANLQIDEEENLLLRKAKAESAAKISESVAKITGILDGDVSVTESLWKIQSHAQILSDSDENAEEIFNLISDICIRADDFSAKFFRYTSIFDENTESVDEIEERLEEIHLLKKKYGKTIKEVIFFSETARKKLERAINARKILENLNTEKVILGKKALSLCSEISAIRKSNAALLENSVCACLDDLGMKNAKFAVKFERRNGFSASGYDKVEFMFSANVGEEIKPLSKIASGGEMSRIALALKTVLAEGDIIDTFIFDEIDTGISGRAAQQVATKLALLGKHRQILCITHLPQIAAMGDSNFFIEKLTAQDHTTTTVTKLTDSGKIKEIARLIGGAEITAATIAAAKDMCIQADNLKALAKVH